MAKEKKSFVLYSDQKELFEALTDEDAGKLIKHIFKYVNDEDPELNNALLKIAFVPIKQQLKRDLKSWETKRQQRVEAGKRSAELRKRKSTSVNDRTRKPTVNVNDNVNVNVNDNVNDIDTPPTPKGEIFNFLKSLIDLGVEERVAKDWMKVRKTKRATNTITAFNRLKSQIEKSGKDANECIKIAVERDWKGFEAEWLNNQQPQQTYNKPSRTAHVHVVPKFTDKDFVDPDNL